METIKSILEEKPYIVFDSVNKLGVLTEAEDERKRNNKHLKVWPLNVEATIKDNNMKEVTDPIHFIRDGVPNPNGLLSNEIFGITKDERANIFAYIDLHDWFMHPLIYKLWSRMDGRIKEIVHGTKKFIINDNGDFEENENGKNGVKFIKDNMDKIVIRSTESRKRNNKIEYIEKYKKDIFMTKMIVIPAYYRDVNTSGGNVGVGILNKYYASLLVNVRSLSETQDYGLSMSEAVRGRIQEIIVQIYDCICGTSGAETDGIGLSKKKGLVRTAVMSKTADYGSRLIITSPELKVNSVDDIMVTLEYAAIPLPSVCANFKPFMIFAIKRFFENEFGGGTKYPCINKKGELEYMEVKDPLITFSEDVINEEMKKFIYGYSNRLTPVKIPLENGGFAYMNFKGYSVKPEDIKNNVGEGSIIDRRMTWCDIFYIAACEVVKDKHVLITRFPIDSLYSQTPMKIRVSSLKEIEPVKINNELYRFYPKIREEDIGKNTSNLFIDSLQMSNLYLKGFAGDYDGDQVSSKGVYTIEANDEIEKFMNGKTSLISANGTNIRVFSGEANVAIDALTKVLSTSEKNLTKNVKIG